MVIENSDSDSDLHWYLESKFQPHNPNIDLLARPRLLSLLDDALEKKLLLLRAPAGYGKSALLGQWFSTFDANEVYAAWLTLDAQEKDEKHFLTSMVLALDYAGVAVGNLLTGARNGFEGWLSSHVIRDLIVTFNTLDRKCVLVFEDYHISECPQINEIVMRMLREVTSNLCLVIDSRVLPELDALSLIVSGNAIEIPASQLKLTQSETVELLEGSINEKDAKRVFFQTEGWMMAVQLAKLQRKTRPQENIDQLSQGNFIPSYLTKQVLSGLAEKEQEFLLIVSFLKRFNVSIAAYISGNKDSLSIISELKSLSPLIVQLDLEGGWYRLHHLFASYLRELLALKDPSKPHDVLLKASHWHSQRGDLVQAVAYAAQAEAYDECHDIISRAGGWRIILTDGIGILRAALREIPSEEISKSPSSLIARAYLHSKDGEIPEARASLERAWHLQSVSNPDIEVNRLVVESMINLYEDRECPTKDFLDLKETYLDSGKLSALERATVIVGDVIYAIARSEFKQADSELQVALELMRESDSVLGLNYCYLHAAQIALYLGDMDLARATNKRALQMAEENFGSDSGLKNLAQLFDYSMMAWTGLIKEEMLHSFEEVLARAMEFDGWTEIYMLGLDAFVMAAVRFDKQSLAISTLRKFLSHSLMFKLDRLSAFVDALIKLLVIGDASLGVQYSSTYSNEQGDGELNLESDPRYWFVDLRVLSNRLLKTEDEDCAVECDSFMQFLQTRKLLLHEITLGIQKVRHLVKRGARDAAKACLFDLVKKAASRKIMGPFMISNSLIALLYDIKQEYRNSDSDYIEYNFVSEILAQATLNSQDLNSTLMSERETEILVILAKGKSNKEIARDLELTENTVKFHLKRIFSKLAVDKRTKAILEAKKLGLI